MSSIDSLPADQRAVLELVLRRGRSYDEIAQLLSIDRAGVRQRALAAFDALGPKTRVAPNRRALITDYLLQALPSGVADEVRDHLLGSASERAWARAVASELQGLTDHPLPEIPSNGRAPRAERPRRPTRRGKATPVAEAAAQRPPAAEVPVAAALSNGSPREVLRRSSRLGGAVLLALAAAVAIVLVLVFGVFTGGSTHRHPARAAHTGTPSSSPSTTTNGTKVLAQINLKPPNGGGSPLGVAEVLRINGQTGVVIVANGLAPNRKRPPNHYAVWLYSAPTASELVGVVKGLVGSNGRLETGGGLPSNAARYREVLVTLETTPNPKTPGKIVLTGQLKGL
jgi:hypothetical protein